MAELKDWVEGIRAAAHNARREGNLSLANALDMTRFEVYESYLDEEYTNNRAKRFEDQESRGVRRRHDIVGELVDVGAGRAEQLA